MKIRLLQDLPIDPKHGAKKGNVYDAEPADGKRGSVRYWITSATGEQLGVLLREAEVIPESDPVSLQHP